LVAPIGSHVVKVAIIICLDPHRVVALRMFQPRDEIAEGHDVLVIVPDAPSTAAGVCRFYVQEFLEAAKNRFIVLAEASDGK
jgi:hypothetical protein